MAQTPAVPVWHTVFNSALGELTLVRDDAGLRGTYFRHHWHRPDADTFGPRHDREFDDITAQLEDYLASTRREFEIDTVLGGDAFQQSVLALVNQIPYGATTTYGQLAEALGGGVTAQQVGAAVGRNPLVIVVPCHRVIGSTGKLTGYAGGLARKQHLLELERAGACHSDQTPFQPALFSAVS